MNFWKVDLTTRDGAENAASAGGLMSFVAAGMTVLAMVFVFLSSGAPGVPDGSALVGMLAGVAIEFIIFLIAGFRLRAGKGLYWGGAASLLLAMEIIAKLLAISIVGAFINMIMIVGLVNGVRGAWGLRRGRFVEDFVDVFN